MAVPVFSRMRAITTGLFLLVVFSFVGVRPLAAQSKPAGSGSTPNLTANEALRGKKLVLKDGTFQIVREYQVVGDRVRYYSIERSQWEEIPSSLVDWDATHKAETQPDQRARQAEALAHRVDLEAHPGSLDVDAGLGLPSNVLLPSGDGMFLFNGHSILHLEPHLAQSKLNKGRFIAAMVTPLPVVSTRYTVYLEGKHAATRITAAEPMFFFRTSNGIQPQLRLIRAKIQDKRRAIEYLSRYFTEKKTTADEIPLNIEQANPDTFRALAEQDLAPGEYVLAQLVPNQGIDLEVWDFGVDSPSSKPARKK